MRNDYFNYKKCIDDLSLVLSIAYFYKYSMKVIEKRIVESKYFSLFNSNFLKSESYISNEKLLEEIFFDADTFNLTGISYNELEWVATMYVNLINKSNYSFETIFIYIGINDAIKMYRIYHELDFIDSYNHFMKLKDQSSIIDRKMRNLKLTNQNLSNLTGLSISTIDSLRNRRRNIKKLEASKAIKLADVLHISILSLMDN